MEPTSFNIFVYIFTPILAAVLGGWVGAYLGSRYQENKKEKKLTEVRNIAIKALKILRKYSKQEYGKAEDEFNTSLTITDISSADGTISRVTGTTSMPPAPS